MNQTETLFNKTVIISYRELWAIGMRSCIMRVLDAWYKAKPKWDYLSEFNLRLMGR